MKIDYKVTTIVLAAILIIWLLWTTIGYGMMWFGMGNGQRMSANMMGTSSSMMRNNDNSMMNCSPQPKRTPHPNMVKMMDGKSGKALEKEFISGMIPHHQGAVDMAKVLLKDTTVNPELKKFANDIIKAQEGEIKMMNEWLKKY